MSDQAALLWSPNGLAGEPSVVDTCEAGPVGLRSALDLVGREDLVRCDAAQDECELPGEVVDPVVPEVHAESAGGEQHVRSIAGEEHPAAPEVVGEPRLR